MKLDIATINKRNFKNWKNRQTTWPVLVEKLSITTRTHESFKEYLAMPKSQQAEIKDIGGFVGGYLNNGRRGVGTVRHRQLVTLDIDDCPMDEFDLLFDIFSTLQYELVIHSTHKHSKEKPRLRIILPLDRAVTPDEYEAIGRKLAGEVNIEHFDPTTFQPSRFMYWPSTSSDGEYLFEHQTGEICSADEILASYVDWQDISAWPRISTEEPKLHSEMKQMGDPREKDGIVGAFCRAFDMEDAIETFIPNVYERTETGRYTFVDGQGEGGGIVYQKGLFFYSHHGTDPAGGKLLNAFDLVRIHKYGGQDLDKDAPMGKRESFKSMCDMAMKNSAVKAELAAAAQERPLNQALYEDFAEDLLDENWMGETLEDPDDLLKEKGTIEVINTMGVPDFYLPEFKEDFNGGINSENWQEKIEYLKSKSGNSTEIAPKISNFKLIMIFDEDLRGKIALNDFDKAIYVTGKTPWDNSKELRRWDHTDEAGLKEFLETKYGLYQEAKFTAGIVLTAKYNQFHPIRTYLNKLEWDGIERLDRLFIDYLGADDDEYTRTVTRKAFTAAVARVFKPGCKMDYVCTLVGEEGIKKSSILAEMGGRWFSDSFTTVEGTKAYEQLMGSWIIEIAELQAFNRSETNAIKAFVTKRTDKFRGAYQKHTLDNPRQSVFFATTNEPEFLKGSTGNRRFWPIKVRTKFTGAPIAQKSSNGAEMIVGLPVDQLWAEAKYRYDNGEPLYMSDSLEKIAKQKQTAFTEGDNRFGVIEKYLATPVPSNWDDLGVFEKREWLGSPRFDGTETLRDYVCIYEIWEECLNMDKKDCHKYKSKEVNDIMHKMEGWVSGGEKRHSFGMYGQQRYFERVGKTELVGGVL